MAWYNEIDRYCAEWLKTLSDQGHINHGMVETRSIRELKEIPDGQAHFFAGLGAWSLALRISGIADDAPIWTGSCPCQPFSQSGSRQGFSDERHLWPEWFRLIAEHQPILLFGEQVASKDGLQWLDLVFSDLESAGYTCAAADLCAAGVGAPHRRQRLYFCAYRPGSQWDPSWWKGAYRDVGQGVDDPVGVGSGVKRDEARRSREPLPELDGSSQSGDPHQALANPAGMRRQKGRTSQTRSRREESESGGFRHAVNVANATIERRISWGGPSETSPRRDPTRIESGRLCSSGELALPNEPHPGPARQQSSGEFGQSPQDHRVDPWSETDWILCSDEKIRPTQPGLFPLAHGTPGRLGRLRAYGNAIVPQVAATFIQATLEAIFQ